MQTLLQKLQFKQQQYVLLWQVPENVHPLFHWPSSVTLLHEPESACVDFVLAFVYNSADVQLAAETILSKLSFDTDIPIWFCYIKGTSKTLTTNINRDNGWQPLTPFGLEAVRQIAIDNNWSALRFRHVSFIKTMTRSFAVTDEGKAKVIAQKK